MKSTRMSWFGWMAWNLSLATGLTLSLTSGVKAQSPEYDAQAGSARINGGNPFADYRVDQAAFPGPGAGHAVYQDYAPYPAYGSGYTPPEGVVIDPAFRAAAGLGGPSLTELDRIRFNVLHSNGDIYGVDEGFTNIGAFIPRRVFSDYNLFALNPRLLLDNSGNAGFNLGAIHRFYVPDLDRMFGHSYWWDFSRSYGDEINGFGWSFETVGRYLSLRFNANVNVGETQKVFAQQFFDPVLGGNNIFLPVVESFEAPLNHYQVEAAVPSPVLGKYGLEFGLGGYLLTGSGVEDTLGVSGRAQWQITEDLWVNTVVTNDNLFDTNVQFNVELLLPSGMPSRIARPNPVVMSLTQSVQRSYQVKVARGQRTKYYTEIDPKDNLPLGVAIIDPNAAAGGNGSAGLPYGSIADYMAADAATRAGYDLILVRPRTDGTSTNLNTGIVLTDTQHLFGTSYALGGFQPTYTSTRGSFFVPGTSVGALARLSNGGVPGANVVTLAGNATEVANLFVNGTNTGSGIVSAGAIDGFNIHDNTIFNVIDAVRLTSNTSVNLNCPGEDFGIIQRNVLNGQSGVGNLGASVTHVDGTLNLRIADNTLDPFASAGIEVISSGPTSIVNAVGAGTAPERGILRNTADQMGSGIRLRAEAGGQLLADVQDNVMTNSTSATGAGLHVTAVDPGSTVVLNTLTDNNFAGGAGNGASLSASGGASIVGATTFSGNSFSNNASDGFNVLASGVGSAVTLQGLGDGTAAAVNTFSGNADDGFDVLAIGGGQFTVIDPIVGTIFSNNGDNGLIAIATGAGSNLDFDLGSPTGTGGNIFSGNGGGLATGLGSGATIRLVAGGTFSGGLFNNTFQNNPGAGLNYQLVNTTQGRLVIRSNTVLANGLTGINVSAIDTALTDLEVLSNVSDGSTGGDGFAFNAVNSGISGRLRIVNNGFRRNAGNGININLDNSPINNLQILNNLGGEVIAPGTIDFTYLSDGFVALFGPFIDNHTMSNNSTAGLDIVGVRVLTGPNAVWRPDLPVLGLGGPAPLPFQPQGSSDVTTGLISVNGNGITAGTDPLQDANGAVLAFGGVAVGDTELNLGFDSFNPGEQLVFELAHSDDANSIFRTDGNDLVGSTVEVTLADGRTLNGTMTLAPGVNNQATVTINQLIAGTNAGITNNGLAGVRINAENGSHINAMAIEGNNIELNQTHGVEIIADDSRLPGNGNVLSVRNNTITNQVAGDGFRMLDPHVLNSQIHLVVQDNTITGNGGAGVNVAIDQATTMQFAARVNNISNNGSIGLAMRSDDDSAFLLVLGDPNVDGNIYDANVDAGVGVTVLGNSAGRLIAANSTFSNTTDGNTPGSFFSGEGLAVITGDNATFAAGAFGNVFTGNASAGLLATATGDNIANFSQIFYFDIGGPNPDDGNLFQENLNGVQFIRTANGRIGAMRPVNIQNNTITRNRLDGISLSSQQSFVTDFYTIQDNLITFNSEQGVTGNPIGNAGIHLDAQADAQLRADIARNTITDNFLDGILTTDDSNFPTDQRSVGGTWTQNLIARNGGNGINLLGAVDELFIGDEFDPALGNIIENNAFDGVNNFSAGTWSLANNLIQLNGVHGVDIDGVGFKDIRLVRNHITLNGTGDNGFDGPGDGIEFNNNFQFILLSALGNTVDFNEGRGLDILNQNDAFSQIVIADDPTSGDRSIFNANGGEGIYVVNTSSTTQNQSAVTPSQGFANGTDQPVGGTHKGMNADSGDLGDSAFLDISIDNALVVANGQDDTVTDFQATGIVFRIGTTGGGFFDPSGFLSDIFASDQFLGGVVASLTNNTMGGNFGDDLFFESFTSTVAPGATGGTWDQNTFNVTGYSSDPLARLDLTYRNNTFIENPTLDPLLVVPALVTAQGAYYDNGEGVFKSRLNNIAAPNIAGPFASAARRRNAQRQPLRTYGDGTVLAPAVGPDGGSFMYPGMGDSTFRIDILNSDPIATLQNIGFIFDTTTPLFSQGDANGVFYPIGGNTQDFRSPWGWGTF